MENVAASFQQAVVDVLVNNIIMAAERHNIRKIALAGGVASNSSLRSEITKLTSMRNMEVYYPRPILCTDNAAMIGCAAYYEYMEGRISDFSLNAVPGLTLGDK